MEEEIWKDIPGYEGYYQASTLGRVRSLDRIINILGGERIIKGRVLALATNLRGYRFIYLYRDGGQRMLTVHRIVAMTFIPNPDSLPQINHKDENKLNNSVDNLEWCTAKYNNNYGNRIEKTRRKLERGIVAYDKSGAPIGLYKSLIEASRLLGLAKSTICTHAKNGKPSKKGIIIQYQ